MDSAGSGTALLSVDEREAREPSAISIQRDLHGDIEFVVPLDRSGSAARVVTVVQRNPVIEGLVNNDQLIEVAILGSATVGRCRVCAGLSDGCYRAAACSGVNASSDSSDQAVTSSDAPPFSTSNFS